MSTGQTISIIIAAIVSMVIVFFTLNAINIPVKQVNTGSNKSKNEPTQTQPVEFTLQQIANDSILS